MDLQLTNHNSRTFPREVEGTTSRVDTFNHLFEHACGGHARQVRTAGSSSQRQSQPNQIVGGITDYGLVEIANLDGHSALGVRQGAEVSDMAIAANPHRRPVRDLAGALIQPIVEGRMRIESPVEANEDKALIVMLGEVLSCPGKLSAGAWATSSPN